MYNKDNILGVVFTDSKGNWKSTYKVESIKSDTRCRLVGVNFKWEADDYSLTDVINCMNNREYMQVDDSPKINNSYSLF